MKRLIITTIVLLVIIASTVAGCSNKSLVGPAPEAEGEVVSTCVTCHTDKATLQELAEEETEAVSTETTGEG
jgi:cytochrome c553